MAEEDKGRLVGDILLPSRVRELLSQWEALERAQPHPLRTGMVQQLQHALNAEHPERPQDDPLCDLCRMSYLEVCELFIPTERDDHHWERAPFTRIDRAYFDSSKPRRPLFLCGLCHTDLIAHIRQRVLKDDGTDDYIRKLEEFLELFSLTSRMYTRAERPWDAEKNKEARAIAIEALTTDGYVHDGPLSTLRQKLADLQEQVRVGEKEQSSNQNKKNED